MADEENEIETTTCALVDANDVFLRIVTIPTEQVNDRHIEEITSCDLPTGKYRWNRTKQTFEALLPLAVRQADQIMSNPGTLNALVAGLKAASDAGVAMPEETIKLIEAHDMVVAQRTN